MNLLRKWKNEETKSAYIRLFWGRRGVDAYSWDIAETVATGIAEDYSKVDVIEALKICMKKSINQSNYLFPKTFNGKLNTNLSDPYWTQERLDAVDWEHLADIMITEADRRLMRQ